MVYFSGVSIDLKEQFTLLIEQLKIALEEVPEENSEEAEAILLQSQQLTQAISDNKPNKYFVKVSAEGLEKAANNIAKIAPPVIEIVTQILPLAAAIAAAGLG